ncbi:hypothetical protein QTP86_006493 [Hemibagrus guttatus]|nr:hypothetical protein QTP86_006493 [Hemibagrus guttatus]
MAHKGGMYVESSSAETALRHFATLLRTGRGNPAGETNSRRAEGEHYSAQLRFHCFRINLLFLRFTLSVSFQLPLQSTSSSPGPLGDFMEEMDTLLSVFPSDSTPLTVLVDFKLPFDKLQSSGLLALLNSFSLSFNICPPTQKGGNVLDLVFTCPSPVTDMTTTPLHISDHHLWDPSLSLSLSYLNATPSISLSLAKTFTLSPLPL